MRKTDKGMLRLLVGAPARCQGKVSYDKKGAVTAKNLRFSRDRVRLRMYPHFDHWHLTKQEKKTDARSTCGK